MQTQMSMTVFSSNFGTIEDNGQKFASIQTLTDFEESGNKCGCEISKVKINTENDFAVSKQINMELSAARKPIQIIANVRMGSQGGKVTLLVNSFEMDTGK